MTYKEIQKILSQHVLVIYALGSSKDLKFLCRTGWVSFDVGFEPQKRGFITNLECDLKQITSFDRYLELKESWDALYRLQDDLEGFVWEGGDFELHLRADSISYPEPHRGFESGHGYGWDKAKIQAKIEADLHNADAPELWNITNVIYYPLRSRPYMKAEILKSVTTASELELIDNSVAIVKLWYGPRVEDQIELDTEFLSWEDYARK